MRFTEVPFNAGNLIQDISHFSIRKSLLGLPSQRREVMRVEDVVSIFQLGQGLWWDGVELVGALGLALSRIQDSSGRITRGEAESTAGQGAVASGSQAQEVSVCAGPKVMVSTSFSVSWIWWSVKILPCNSAISSAGRTQLTREVSGAMDCRRGGGRRETERRPVWVLKVHMLATSCGG